MIIHYNVVFHGGISLPCKSLKGMGFWKLKFVYSKVILISDDFERQCKHS